MASGTGRQCGRSPPAPSGHVAFCRRGGGGPLHPPPLPQPGRGALLSLQSPCHVFFATWCHLTREVASHSPAEGLGPFQALGRHDAATAAGSGDRGRRPALEPRGGRPCTADLRPGQAVCLLCTAWARAAPSRKHFDQRTSQKSSLNLCSAAHHSHDLGQVACPHEPQVPHL